MKHPAYFLFNSKAFVYFAKHYKVSGGSIQHLCEHNQKVALAINQIEIAQIWSILQLLYSKDSKNTNTENQKTFSFSNNYDLFSDIILDDPLNPDDVYFKNNKSDGFYKGDLRLANVFFSIIKFFPFC